MRRFVERADVRRDRLGPARGCVVRRHQRLHRFWVAPADRGVDGQRVALIDRAVQRDSQSRIAQLWCHAHLDVTGADAQTGTDHGVADARGDGHRRSRRKHLAQIVPVPAPVPVTGGQLVVPDRRTAHRRRRDRRIPGDRASRPRHRVGAGGRREHRLPQEADQEPQRLTTNR